MSLGFYFIFSKELHNFTRQIFLRPKFCLKKRVFFLSMYTHGKAQL